MKLSPFCSGLRFAALSFFIIAGFPLQAKSKLSCEPKAEPNGSVLLTDFSNPSFWSAGGKENKTPEIGFNEKTPEGEAALTYNSPNEVECTFRGAIYQGCGEWRKSGKFHGLSFWIKNNSSAGLISIRPSSRAGKYINILYRLPEKNTWQLVYLPLGKYDNKDFDPAKIRHFIFKTYDKVNFSMGPVRMESGKRPIFLAKRPQINAVSAEKPPVIDGALNDAVWSNATEYELKYQTKREKAPVEKTKFKLAYDKDNIYLGATLECKDTSKLKADIKEDGMPVLWQDDCLEFILEPKNDLNSYCHFIINSLGKKSSFRRAHDKVRDALVTDTQWPAKWQGACQISPKVWTIELAIPLSQLGLKDMEGKSMFFQLGRENHEAHEYSSFSSTAKFPAMANFANATFTKNNNKNLKIVDASLQKVSDGKFVINAVVGGANPGNDILFEVEMTNPEGVKLKNSVSKMPKGKFLRVSIPVDYPAESEGLHRVTIKASDKNGPIFDARTFRHTLPVTAKYGDIILNPMPKELKWKKGYLTLLGSENIVIPENATKRTEKTAKILSEELYDLSGEKFEVHRSKDIEKASGIKLSVTGNGEPEGYALDVGGKDIVLQGNDEPGLYYAVVTLMQIARGNMRIAEKPEIRKVSIKDWPDLRYRYYSESPNWRRKQKDNPRDMEWYKRYFKRFIAGQKYNMLSFSVNNGFMFENTPKLKDSRAFMSKKFQLELARLCKDHFVEFIPTVQSGGHFNWVPRSKFPELFEKGFKRQGDPTNPAYYKFLFPVMDELIEGTDSKYFNILHDEWWSHPPAGKTDVYKGVPRKKILFDDIVKEYEYLKGKKLKTMMYADMILKGHNGNDKGPRKGLYTIAKDLPKDIIIINWSTTVDPYSNKILHDLGFEVIVANNGFAPCPKDRDNINGYGVLSYGLGMLTDGIVKDTFLLQFGYTPNIRCADYAWNFKSDPGTPLKEFERARMSNVGPMNAVKANPAASAELNVVPLKNYENSKVKTILGANLVGLPDGVKEFGFIPMEILKSGKKCIALEKDKNPLIIPVNKKVSALYFLQGMYLEKTKRKQFFALSKDYIFGIPAAEYIINYADGSKQIVKARFGANILDVNPPVARCRFMPDIRYIWSGKTDDGKDAYLYQYEWGNPNPKKEVVSIGLKSAGTDAVPMLFALTARGVKKRLN